MTTNPVRRMRKSHLRAVTSPQYIVDLPYLSIGAWAAWEAAWYLGPLVGIFRNRSGIIPGRWGFFFLAFEVGSRNPGDRIGVWLKEHGLWPW